MKRRTLHIVLGLALAATLAAVWFVPAEDDGLATSPRAPAPVVTASGTATQKLFNVMRSVVNRPSVSRDIDVLAILPRERDSEEANQGLRLFSSNRGNQVEAAPVEAEPTPEVAPPPPEAPPLPFRFIGRYNDGHRILFFFELYDQSLSVRIGDTITDEYRLERLQGTTLTFRYLPLNQLQEMNIGGVQ